MQLYQGDCLEVMKQIPDKSVDMILCDLPYGTTACKWDTIIPFEPLWCEYNRIIKDNGAICLFAAEPFASLLRTSNLEYYRYDWIWQKQKPSNFQLMGYQCGRVHEFICVFSRAKACYVKNGVTMKYYPQTTKRKSDRTGNVKIYTDAPLLHMYNGGKKDNIKTYKERQPISILQFNTVEHRLHPTQKPVPLLEYLIKTYTNEGETVLDNCMGSGSTGVAAKNLNRDFIGIELDENYFEIAKTRILDNVE